MKTRVAVLGGGAGALSAAFELTATPELRERYEVTVHQLGWRLGGKGASGRNRKLNDRIEEHGLHLWFGFYENAFTLMRKAYGELDRPAGAPLATWEDAFHPSHGVVIYESYEGRWIPHRVFLPPNPLTPGDTGDPSERDIVDMALERVLGLVDEVVGEAGHKVGTVVSMLLRQARELIPGGDDEPDGKPRLPLIAKVIGLSRDALWKHVVEDRVDHDRLRYAFMILDLAATVIEGVDADDLFDRGFTSVNEEELREWLRRHGAKEVTLESSPFLRGVYDGVFGYVEGDKNRPNVAAGTALKGLIRTLFAYKGAWVYKMQAGMGDVVFTPLYEVLRARGVRFEFFDAVTNLELSEDRRHVDGIEIVRQVELREGDEYHPLVDVKGLPCWPSEPLWDQLVDGADLEARGVSFEHSPNPLGRPARTLRRGEDFDVAVLGIPLGALPEICGELIADAANPRFRAMVENVPTVMTQAFQLWLHKPESELGFPYEDKLFMTCYVEPLDTYCNMAHLIPHESWTPADDCADIAYFCGALPHAGITDQAGADAAAYANACHYLIHDTDTFWPDADGRVGPGFDWNLLLDGEDRKGEDRLRAQYVRANFTGTERYVLSTAGSIKYRLWPDESGYENLVLAGDWTRNGFDGGAVEAAVTSGMLAARAICGAPADVPGTSGWLVR